MDGTTLLDPAALETLLRRALGVEAPTSLRVEGSNRLLGDLHLRGLEPGAALHLLGAKRRDHLPETGAEVLLSLLLGDEVLTIQTTLLQAADPVSGDEASPLLRVAWPTRGVGFHRRADVRVAAPDQAPLDAVLRAGGAGAAAQVLNLTETGVGVGFREGPPPALGTQVLVETRLPEGTLLALTGEVRHLERLDGDSLPWRAGIVLKGTPDAVLETLRAFVQTRRTDRSETLRQGPP